MRKLFKMFAILSAVILGAATLQAALTVKVEEPKQVGKIKDRYRRETVSSPSHTTRTATFTLDSVSAHECNATQRPTFYASLR